MTIAPEGAERGFCRDAMKMKMKIKIKMKNAHCRTDGRGERPGFLDLPRSMPTPATENG